MGGKEQNRHPPKHIPNTKGAVGKPAGFVRPVCQPVGAVRRRGRAARCRSSTAGGAQGRGIRLRGRAGGAGWGGDGCMDSQSYPLSPFTGTDNVRFETFPVFSDSGECAPAREPVGSGPIAGAGQGAMCARSIFCSDESGLGGVLNG